MLFAFLLCIILTTLHPRPLKRNGDTADINNLFPIHVITWFDSTDIHLDQVVMNVGLL